jgi:hypothetical protein
LADVVAVATGSSNWQRDEARPHGAPRTGQTGASDIVLGPEVVGDPMPRADIYRVLGFTATAFTELIRVIDIFCALRQESDGKIL